jgi:hypothetical protein
VSLSFLHDYLDLDENLLPAYVVGRMVDEGIVDKGAFYHMRDNKRVMTIGYRLKQ